MRPKRSFNMFKQFIVFTLTSTLFLSLSAFGRTSLEEINTKIDKLSDKVDSVAGGGTTNGEYIKIILEGSMPAGETNLVGDKLTYQVPEGKRLFTSDLSCSGTDYDYDPAVVYHPSIYAFYSVSDGNGATREYSELVWMAYKDGSFKNLGDIRSERYTSNLFFDSATLIRLYMRSERGENEQGVGLFYCIINGYLADE